MKNNKTYIIMNKNKYISPEATMIDLDCELTILAWSDGKNGNKSLQMDQYDDIDDFA
jgi:hypothetical protein